MPIKGTYYNATLGAAPTTSAHIGYVTSQVISATQINSITSGTAISTPGISLSSGVYMVNCYLGLYWPAYGTINWTYSSYNVTGSGAYSSATAIDNTSRNIISGTGGTYNYNSAIPLYIVIPPGTTNIVFNFTAYYTYGTTNIGLYSSSYVNYTRIA
jgi:hypothetical protein